MMEPDPSNSGDVIKILDNDSQIILMHNNYVFFRTVRAFYPQLSFSACFYVPQNRRLIINVELKWPLSKKLIVDQLDILE